MANDITQLTRKPEGCLAEPKGAARHLDRCRFVDRPSFECTRQVLDDKFPRCQNMQNGCTAGNIMRPPFPSAITGKRWCCLNRLLLIRPISGRTQVRVRVPSSTVPHSVRFSSAARVVHAVDCHSSSPKPNVSVGRSWTSWAGTGEPARDLAGCVQERCPWNERWRESVGKQEPLPDALSIA